MKVSLFYLPSVGNKAQIEQGMVGLRGDLYDQMLREISAQARLADDLGYDSISFTEHHFHVEGFELSNNPVLLDLYIAMQTKRLRVGQLGIVLPAQQSDSRRRGHRDARSHDRRPRQRRLRARLSAPLGRHHGAADPRHPRRAAASARRDRRRQPRRVRGMLPHHQAGVDPGLRSATRASTGACRRARRRGRSRRRRSGAAASRTASSRPCSVVPKPVQKPHPPIFQPFASSERSIRWCAQEGVTAVLPPLLPGLRAPAVRRLCRRLGQAARRGDGRAARRHHRRHRRGGARHLARERLLLRPRMVSSRSDLPRDWTIRKPARRRTCSRTASRWSARSTP